jgi:DNA-binding Lrp family transcriptional regulator
MVTNGTLDRTDAKIIELLQKDARVSYKELAASVGLAPSSCYERLRQLREAGIFSGFHAEVVPAALGPHLRAMIAVRLSNHDVGMVKSFAGHVLGLEETREVYHLAGEDDFQLHVLVRDSDHLRGFVLDQLTGRPEVAHVQTSLVFEYNRNPVMPVWLEEPCS